MWGRARVIIVDFFVAALSGFLVGDFVMNRLPMAIEMAVFPPGVYYVRFLCGAALAVFSILMLHNDVKAS